MYSTRRSAFPAIYQRLNYIISSLLSHIMDYEITPLRSQRGYFLASMSNRHSYPFIGSYSLFLLLWLFFHLLQTASTCSLYSTRSKVLLPLPVLWRSGSQPCMPSPVRSYRGMVRLSVRVRLR